MGYFMSNKENKLLGSTIVRFLIIVSFFAISACSYARPNARILRQVPSGAPENYQQGWIDGCESGMAIVGNSLYKVTYHNKISQQLVDSIQYYRGWNEAKTYCAHYTMATLWEAGTLPNTPTEENGILPEIPKGVFSVAASWGTPTVFNWNGTDIIEDEGEGFAGFGYR